MATTSTYKQHEETLKGKAQEAVDTAKEYGEKAKDTAKDTATGMVDKAKEFASNVADRTKETVSNVGQRAEDATHTVGRGMECLSNTIRENLPQSGVIGSAASTLAGGLEQGGKYLEKESLEGITNDVINVIRRNPIPAFVCGIGLGFIFARLSTMSFRR